MNTIFNILEYIVLASVGLCLLSIITSLYSVIRYAINHGYTSTSEGIKDFFSTNYSHISEVTKEKKITVFASLLVICFALIISPTVHEAIGLHNLLLEGEGTHCYYVEITDYKNTYTLPASIRIEEEVEDYGEKSKTTAYFYVEKVYFSNGGYLDFSDNDYVDIGDWCYMVDQHGKEWEVTLINEHAYSPYIQETQSGNIFNIVMLVLELCVMILVATSALCEKETKEQTEHR